MKSFEVTGVEVSIPPGHIFSIETFVPEEWARDTLNALFEKGVFALNLNLPEHERGYAIALTPPHKNPGA